MNNGYQKSNGCNADKEGGKFYNMRTNNKLTDDDRKEIRRAVFFFLITVAVEVAAIILIFNYW